MSATGGWDRLQERHLRVQGFELEPERRRRLGAPLRFATGVCLVLVASGLALRSPALLGALAPIGLAAGTSARHPFDRVWNTLARRWSRERTLPPTPRRRRLAFRLAAAWLATTAVLFAVGAVVPALILGGVLVALCALQTATFICVPSLAIALWERVAQRGSAASARDARCS